jgi:hypothetical protein
VRRRIRTRRREHSGSAIKDAARWEYWHEGNDVAVMIDVMPAMK